MAGLFSNMLAIALGGALGALARFGAGRAMSRLFDESFWGTLTVNLIGSIAIGICFLLIIGDQELRQEWEGMVVVGFLGAFTTFSAFSLEVLMLISAGRLLAASGYVLASIGLCVTGCMLGMRLARLLL